ncbi:cupin domain-containing protein [Microbacterium sp. NPDC064584]|uniref:cupin domain-containing protein n=1 Tax=Microbacterium sp. NPDC064584 TaxID=3155817 RepID=UPI0034149510
MDAFSPVDVLAADLPLVEVPREQVTSGSPRTGVQPVLDVFGVEIGIWEMTEGGMRDIEIDEVFIVLEGEASVTLLVDEVETERIDLRPGSLCRLSAGSATRWDVSRALRKVYVIEREASDS